MCVPEYLLVSVEPYKALRPPGTGAWKSRGVGSRNGLRNNSSLFLDKSQVPRNKNLNFFKFLDLAPN